MKNSKLILLAAASLLVAVTGCTASSDIEEAASSSSAASTSLNSEESVDSSTKPEHGNPPAKPGDNPGGGPSSDSSSVSYSAIKEFTSTESEENNTYTSSSADESAVLVKTTGIEGTLINPTVIKSGDTSSADNSSFYGQNASLLSTEGTLNVKGGTIDSSAEGGAGAFSYAKGTVNIADTSINTTANAAGGIHVSGGGTLNAWDLTLKTEGEHSAAIRSDRGGGTMNVNGGTYTSSGQGSPAIYSTADIDVNNAELVSHGSEAACIEGKNSISLFNSTLTGKMKDSTSNPNSDGSTWGVILYQSMSGDSEVGTSSFSMVDSTLDILNGGYFYSTNTASEFYLNNVNLKHTDNDDYEYLIRATGSSKWGNGTGTDMNFTADNQTMEGKIIYDTASTVDLYLENGSSYKGSTEESTTYTGKGTIDVTVDSSSKWILTESCSIDVLHLKGSLIDEEGNNIRIIDESGNVLKDGTSSLTLTVSSYDTDADLTEAVKAPAFNEAVKPDLLK